MHLNEITFRIHQFLRRFCMSQLLKTSFAYRQHPLVVYSHWFVLFYHHLLMPLHLLFIFCFSPHRLWCPGADVLILIPTHWRIGEVKLFAKPSGRRGSPWHDSAPRVPPRAPPPPGQASGQCPAAGAAAGRCRSPFQRLVPCWK